MKCPQDPEKIVVTTYRRENISTSLEESHRVPLSIADLHLRQEQLPFCYFFDESLDEVALENSLRINLADFPQTGGTICPQSHSVILCTPQDTVHVSFGKINRTLQQWQSRPRGHDHQSFDNSSNPTSARQPVLLPLFDPLFQEDSLPRSSSLTSGPSSSSLVTIRITYFQGPGTAIAVNFCHALGDTASCIQFAQSWGQHMLGKNHDESGERGCNDRSKACVSGMMNADTADVMGLSANNTLASVLLDAPLTRRFADYFHAHDWLRMLSSTFTPSFAESSQPTPTASTSAIPHEYVRLSFPVIMLSQLKNMGSSSCRVKLSDEFHLARNYHWKHESVGGLVPFLSTNDMITAYGWLLKRHLSRKSDHNLSMVVNLRGREGVPATLFGNGISHVVATTPARLEQHPQVDRNLAKLMFTKDLCLAAKAVRQSLQQGWLDLPEALVASRVGCARPKPSACSTQSFSTTSWTMFPLYKISFGESRLSGFHGHPAHPLQRGRTYSSVITPCPDGGYWYEMLLPSDQAQQARERHAVMTSICMSWTDSSGKHQDHN